VLSTAIFCFFFQAEDGIRYFHVTGVQTCALPICPPGSRRPGPHTWRPTRCAPHVPYARLPRRRPTGRPTAASRRRRSRATPGRKIGRAACREREESGVGLAECQRTRRIRGAVAYE